MQPALPKMTLLLLLLLLLQMHDWADSHSLSKQSALVQCPIVDKDQSVVSRKEFQVPLNPATPSESFGLVKAQRWIYKLRIVRKAFIPKTIFGLKYLGTLEIKQTCFEPCLQKNATIPSEIQCLASSLLVLSIENTPLARVPEELGRLAKLHTLKLIRTGLVSLPDAIGELSALVTLDLSNNQLRELPKTIAKLRSLKFLTLANNPFLRSIQAINGLPSLSTLDARHCRIDSIPRDLPQLHFLQMQNNTLSDLLHIETIGGQATRTKQFYFSANQIHSVGPELFAIKNLTKLHLANNQITTLPTDAFDSGAKLELIIEQNCFSQPALQHLSRILAIKNPHLSLHSADQKTCSK